MKGFESYRQQLSNELTKLAEAFDQLLDDSTILPHNWGPGFIGFPHFYWGPSDADLQMRRMAALEAVRDLETRARLLFPNTTPEVSQVFKDDFGLLRRWAKRGKGDHSLPRLITEAKALAADSFSNLAGLLELLPDDEWATRLVVDTNALVDDPDLARYSTDLGPKYMAHILPIVLRELDDLKRSGRTPELREAAKRADRRLKGIRTNGDVRTGARVQGSIYAVFEHVEPRAEGLPDWLDLDVPDDRFVASTMLLQSRHPGSAVVAATSDLNLQNKLAAAGLPFIEPPDPS